MFEFLTASSSEAINLIKKDHDNVKELFDKFEKATSLREKKKIAADTILELKLHAAIEEEIFYAVVRPKLEKKIMNEADEEHHVVKLLVAELELMDGTEDHYDAKYKVLSENVRHHIKEEEHDMLPKARALDIDFEALGLQIEARKADLKKNGVAIFAEERLMSKNGGKSDSPAKAATVIKSSKSFRKVKSAKKQSKSKIIKLTKPAEFVVKKARKMGSAKTASFKTVKPKASKSNKSSAKRKRV